MNSNGANVYIPVYLPRNTLKSLAKEAANINCNNDCKGRTYTINMLIADIITQWCDNPIIYKAQDITRTKEKKKKISVTIKRTTFNKLIKLYINNFTGEISYRNDLILHIIKEHLKK